jgi:hypothetical protein
MSSFGSKKSLASVLSRGLALVLCTFGASGAIGCSDSSSGSAPIGDASAIGDALATDGPAVAVEAGPPPLGVPIATCAGCAVCGGVLGSPTTGISYCTQDCTTDTDCPSGLGCVAALSSSQLSNECIKTCSSNTDCIAPFICRHDLPTAGNFCWSPYPPQQPEDAGSAVADTGAASGPDGSVGAGDAAPVEAGPADAAVTDGGADGPTE